VAYTCLYVPVGIVVFLIPLVIVSHSLTEEGRKVLERLIYDRRTRTLRASLRQLSKLAVEQADLNVVLSRSLEAICHPVLATYGVILVFEGESACPAGSYRWHKCCIKGSAKRSVRTGKKRGIHRGHD